GERAARAALVDVAQPHEVIDDQLARPSNRLASRAVPSGPVKTYSLVISTIGRARRPAASAACARLSCFSLVCNAGWAASHSSRDAIFGSSMGYSSAMAPVAALAILMSASLAPQLQWRRPGNW